MYGNAGFIFRSAVEMCQAISAPVNSVQHRREALASIVLAAISCESFINELAQLAVPGPKAPGWLTTLRSILEEAEESHASIESKYLLTKFILTGQPFDKGALPFQDFALLIDVRNMLVHAKPVEANLERNDKDEYIWTKPPLMRRLQSARILGVDDSLKEAARRNNAEKLIADMFAQVSSQPVALWACRAASAIVNDILSSIPNDSPLLVVAELGYRRDFQSPV